MPELQVQQHDPVVAATVMTGAVAYAASSSLTTASRDNVGQLQPTANVAPAITVIVDPATGVATFAPTTTSPAATTSGATITTRTRGEREQKEAGDD